MLLFIFFYNLNFDLVISNSSDLLSLFNNFLFVILQSLETLLFVSDCKYRSYKTIFSSLTPRFCQKNSLLLAFETFKLFFVFGCMSFRLVQGLFLGTGLCSISLTTFDFRFLFIVFIRLFFSCNGYPSVINFIDF